MDRLFGLDLLKSESLDLEAFEEEMKVLSEKYDNFIILVDTKNLTRKKVKPIDSLKKVLDNNYDIDFISEKSLIIEVEENVVKDLFEKEEVKKDAFVVLNNEALVMNFNN